MSGRCRGGGGGRGAGGTLEDLKVGCEWGEVQGCASTSSCIAHTCMNPSPSLQSRVDEAHCLGVAVLLGVVHSHPTLV